MLTNEAELMAERALEVAKAEEIKRAEEAKIEEARVAALREQESLARERIKKFNAKYFWAIIAQLPDGMGKIDEDGQLVVSGVRIGYHLDIKQEYEHQSRFRSRPTDRYSRVVGDFGGKRRVPQRKDGSHNYAEIASLLRSYAENKLSAMKMQNTQSINEVHAKSLREELGVNDYYGPMKVKASADKAKPVFVEIAISRAMTADEARQVHATLVGLGLIQTKKEG